MKFSALVTLVALPIALGNPFHFNTRSTSSLRLLERDLRQMEIYYCNECTPDPSGDDPPQCEQYFYATTGGSTTPTCNDPSIPLNDDACSAYGQIPTPYGSGNWQATSKCGDTTEGAYDGCITADDQSWTCTCFASSGQFSENCGLEYACSNTYTCECDTCNNNNCGTCGG